MADDSYDNDKREPNRDVSNGNGASSPGADELELLRMLRENPALRARLRDEFGAAPKSDSVPPASLPSSAPLSSSASTPKGLPIAGRSSSGSGVPKGLPSAPRSTDGASPLPDAFRRGDSTPPSFSALPASSPLPTRGAPFETNVPPTSPKSDAVPLQTVPVPPRRDDAETTPESVPSVVPTRKKGKIGRRETVEQAPESAPDLSTMAPLAARPESDLATLGTMIAGIPATASVAGLSKATPDALGILSTDEAWSQSTPDAFLELLEKRNPRTPEATSAAQEVALLRDQTALERAANDAPMWLVSLFLHVILIIILAFLVVNVEMKDLFQIVSEPGFSDEVVLDDVFDPDAAFETVEDANFETTDMPEVESDVVADVPDVSSFTEETAAPLTLTETALALDSAPVGEVENLLGSLNGDDLSGRGENKAAALATGGGTEGSEKSVALALAWLAEHQLPDGSWSYDLRNCLTCGGKCKDSGTIGITRDGSDNARIAATAMGVLPFLAAGNTPTTGKYKRVVARGISYLINNGSSNENGLDFRDKSGRMYSHAIATIAVCETYAMLTPRERTRNPELRYAAQEATRFIEYAQANDGGWRYQPRELIGDTSVSGWQMMALKSAELAGLDVYRPTVFGMRSFLRDIVAKDGGSRYFYLDPSKVGKGESPQETLATDAIGLLCRLYIDWRVDNPDLVRGAKRLAGEDRSLNNPYYIYYASQLLHNIGGRIWNDWNREMREKLIKTQQMDGHERGSWFPDNPDSHCKAGGRLYATSLNCMVLEVYYRHMPLYQKMEASEAFPLEGPGAVKDAGGASDEPDENFPVEDFTADDDKE